MLTQLAVLVLVILAVGIIVWGIKKAPVIDENFKQVAIIIIIVVAALWVLYEAYNLIVHHGTLPAIK